LAPPSSTKHGLAAGRKQSGHGGALDAVVQSEGTWTPRAVRRYAREEGAEPSSLSASAESEPTDASAGNSGAASPLASTCSSELHDGVERATVATLFPTGGEPVLVLDGGANLDCSAKELAGFAYLGTVYMRDIVGRVNPVVGLLNVGEEEEKGTALVREAHQLLKRSPRLNYVGNIEGRDILPAPSAGRTWTWLVCDGFVGNVVLKFYESRRGSSSG